MSRTRKLLIASKIVFGEPGDIEIGDNAEIIATKERGTITKANETEATIRLDHGSSATLPTIYFRAVRERSKGLDTRVRSRRNA
jgi:hypothetical protein